MQQVAREGNDQQKGSLAFRREEKRQLRRPIAVRRKHWDEENPGGGDLKGKHLIFQELSR